MATICSEHLCSVIDSRQERDALFSHAARVEISRAPVRTSPASASPLSRFIRRVLDWAERRSEQRENRDAFAHLLTLDDSLLNDIGVTRAEVERAARLPLSEDAATSLYNATHEATNEAPPAGAVRR